MLRLKGDRRGLDSRLISLDVAKTLAPFISISHIIGCSCPQPITISDSRLRSRKAHLK